MIPFELKIFNIIWEYGRWLTLALAVVWFVYALLLMIRRNKWFWLWLLILSCVILPLNVGFTWCGWHYRMELRDCYAVDEHGWVNIDRMPPEIRAEYAKHDCHPRFRDLKAQICGCIVMLPVVYFCGGIGWLFCLTFYKTQLYYICNLHVLLQYVLGLIRTGRVFVLKR